jgi:hypothetical protein
MVEDGENLGGLHPEMSDDENTSASDQLYQSLQKVLPEREVELPEDNLGNDGHKSLTEREEESPNKSDVKIMTETLFPDMGNHVLNHLMVSEVFPEAYRPLQAMLVKDRIKKSKSDESVVDIIVEINTPESIAFGREGRFDGLAVIGVSTKAKAAEEASNKLYGN